MSIGDENLLQLKTYIASFKYTKYLWNMLTLTHYLFNRRDFDIIDQLELRKQGGGKHDKSCFLFWFFIRSMFVFLYGALKWIE